MAVRGTLRYLALSASQPAGLITSSTVFATQALSALACSTGLSTTTGRTFATSSSGGSKPGFVGGMANYAARRIEDMADAIAQRAGSVEDRVRESGFVPASDAVPSAEAAGRVGGPGVRTMSDLADVLGGGYYGDSKRAARAVQDLVHDDKVHRSRSTKLPSPLVELLRPKASQDESAASESEEAFYLRLYALRGTVLMADVRWDADGMFEGTMPGTGPAQTVPAVNQNPPENTAAIPGPQLAGSGGATQPL